MRLLITLLLLILLIAAATWEQIFIRQTYKQLETHVDTFYAAILNQIEREENIDTEENIQKIDGIYNYWLKKEQRLCFHARHIDLSQISDALIYAKNFTRFNNAEETCAGVERVKYLIDTHSYNVGTSMQNVI